MKVVLARLHPDAVLPQRMSEHAAGYDLAACLGPETIELAARAWARVPTGLRIAIPDGFEGQVRPRSGLAARHGVTVLNAPGTIDADYRGELMVLLVNLGDAPFRIAHGDRIAQLVIAPVADVALTLVDAIAVDSTRGEGGFGSTGSAGA
ncbi:MAG TPA: dUTP diphosphatase [Nannocystaceae bacterium]|nr:dUTP diphosphatase [Nannocystaceae bacterium]